MYSLSGEVNTYPSITSTYLIIFSFNFPNPIIQPQPKTFQLWFHTSKPVPNTLFNLETINTIFPNLRETPNSCTSLAYLRKTRKPQTRSKQGCFASNQTRTFPNLKFFILNLNSIINKPQISSIIFGTKHVPYLLMLHPIPLN